MPHLKLHIYELRYCFEANLNPSFPGSIFSAQHLKNTNPEQTSGPSLPAWVTVCALCLVIDVVGAQPPHLAGSWGQSPGFLAVPAATHSSAILTAIRVLFGIWENSDFSRAASVYWVHTHFTDC